MEKITKTKKILGLLRYASIQKVRLWYKNE